MNEAESLRTPNRTLMRKRQILEAASRLFRRKGVHGAGMREIAAELGMTQGNLYHYFRSKQDLLAFCQEEGLAGLLELARRLTGAALSPAGRLYLLVVGHVELLNEGTPGSLAHLEVEGLEGHHREGILARRSEYESAVRRFIEAGSRAGLFRPADPRLAARAILGSVNWTVKWFRPEGGKSARQIGVELAELLVRGLLADGVVFTAPDPALLDGEPPLAPRKTAAAAGR